jgi:hypothetical protein
MESGIVSPDTDPERKSVAQITNNCTGAGRLTAVDWVDCTDVQMEVGRSLTERSARLGV